MARFFFHLWGSLNSNVRRRSRLIIGERKDERDGVEKCGEERRGAERREKGKVLLRREGWRRIWLRWRLT